MRGVLGSVLLGSLAACAAHREAPVQAETARHLPNIVIVLADDLGYGDPGCYNDESKIPTPNIDRLATEGLRFTDAHSPSAVCTPTRYGLLTGRYAWRTWLQRGVLWPWDLPLIEADRPTLPGTLREVGYETACIGKWHLGWDWPVDAEGFVSATPRPTSATGPGFSAAERAAIQPRVDFGRPLRSGPLARGFDHYFGDDVPNFPPYAFIEDDRLTALPTAMNDERLFGHDGPMVPGWDFSVVLPTITQRAASFIDTHTRRDPGRPFFLFLALTSPHTPIAPSTRWVGKSGAGGYGDWVAETDWALGEILETLERNGIADDTLIVFTSDNGSPQRDPIGFTGEVGSVREHFGHDASRPWRGLKGDIWEGGHRVPFIARWRGVVPQGATSDEPLELTDLYRTLASLTGARVPNDAAEDSFDLAGVLTGRTGVGRVRDHLVLHAQDGTFAIRAGDWKLILGRGSGGFTRFRPPDDAPAGQLYDLAIDPGETDNQWDRRPEVVAELRDRLDAIRRADRTAPR